MIVDPRERTCVRTGLPYDMFLWHMGENDVADVLGYDL